MQASALFDWPESMPFGDYFSLKMAPWEWLDQIAPALEGFDFPHSVPDVPSGVDLRGPVYLHSTVRLPAYCTVHGPAWIGPEVEIRPGAYIRGNVIVGAGSVLGNACEYKNCLLLESVETPHYNYVGDSVLGNRAHLGAGAICANLRLDRQAVVIRTGDQLFETGRRKVGAFIGDRAEAACKTVLQPGTILGRGSAVLASSFGGVLEANKMVVERKTTRILERPL